MEVVSVLLMGITSTIPTPPVDVRSSHYRGVQRPQKACIHADILLLRHRSGHAVEIFFDCPHITLLA